MLSFQIVVIKNIISYDVHKKILQFVFIFGYLYIYFWPIVGALVLVEKGRLLFY